jgi:hypothetical protein
MAFRTFAVAAVIAAASLTGCGRDGDRRGETAGQRLDTMDRDAAHDADRAAADARRAGEEARAEADRAGRKIDAGGRAADRQH